MQADTAGDPVTGIKWTRRTTEKIAAELSTVGIDVCPNTVAKLLKGLQYRLRVNHKKLCGGSRASRTERDAQFAYVWRPPEYPDHVEMSGILGALKGHCDVGRSAYSR